MRRRFPPRLRLRRRPEYLRVQRGGRRHHAEHFMIVFAKGSGPTRLGITVTRKVGNAVVRNRIKRRVRDVFRRHHHRLPTGLDLVFIAKRNAASASHHAVERDFSIFIDRAPWESMLAEPVSTSGTPQSEPPA